MIAVGCLLLALMAARVEFSGEYAWFFLVPGTKLLDDGKQISGWVHRGGNEGNSAMIVTLAHGARRETYWVDLPTEKLGGVSRCDLWGSSRFPILVFGDVVPSCVFDAGGDQEDGLPHRSQPAKRDLAAGAKWVEFTADDGSRVRASW